MKSKYGNFDEVLMNAESITQEQRENIVRAVNAHEPLIKGLLELRDRLTMAQDSSGNSEINQDEIELINGLLAKAEGK